MPILSSFLLSLIIQVDLKDDSNLLIVKLDMNRYTTKLLLITLAFFSFSMQGFSHDNSTRKGILLVTFGTSYSDAALVFDSIDEAVKKNYPEKEIRWAYTSTFIRDKLAKRGEDIPSPGEALARMSEEGFTHVVVQSLHIIPGSEFHDLVQTVNAFRGLPEGIRHLSVGTPLLNQHHDLKTMSEIVHRQFSDLAASEALVLMGHGSNHAANAYYPAFQYYLDEVPGGSYIGTVEGYPGIDSVVKRLQKEGIEKVCLTPFMSLAGDHAQNDMAGDAPDSWKNILEEEGFEVEILMKGLAEYDEVVDVWMEHLKEAENDWK